MAMTSRGSPPMANCLSKVTQILRTLTVFPIDFRGGHVDHQRAPDVDDDVVRRAEGVGRARRIARRGLGRR